MHIKTVLWLLLAFYSFVSNGQTYNTFAPNTDRVLWVAYWKFKAGDSLHWAKTQHNYANWPRMRLQVRNILNTHQGNYWLKTSIQIKGEISNERILLHHYIVNAASEIYWDGELICTNGKVGKNRQTEQLGAYAVQATVPARLLAPGKHHLAFRVSNYRLPRRSLFGRPNLGNSTAMQKKNYQWVLDHTLITTVLGITILFCILLFFGLSKSASLLFFIGFCVIQMLGLLLNFYGIYENIRIDIYNTLLTLLTIVKAWDGFFLAAYLVYEFQLPQKRYWLLAAAGVSLVSTYYLPVHLGLVITLGLIISLRALRNAKLRNPAIILTIGIVSWAVFIYLQGQLLWGYFIGVFALVISMILASITQMHQRLKHQHRIELRTSRLENQLLKKNIQPHFLMNSLVSLQQLIHENPTKAEEMIDELAIEFHMFSKVAEKKLIALRDELKICEAHLRIMEFRRDATFRLDTINIDGEELIPPAVFHTLVENGITHGYGKKNEGMFVLEKIVNKNETAYRLFNDGETEADPSEEKRLNSGTGLKYIEARLSESFGDAWSMSYGKVAGGWEVWVRLHT